MDSIKPHHNKAFSIDVYVTEHRQDFPYHSVSLYGLWFYSGSQPWINEINESKSPPGEAPEAMPSLPTVSIVILMPW